MNKANTKELINQIMSLNAPVTGTMASSGGYFGAISNKQQAVMDLKKVTACIAAETQKAKPDEAKIADLTDQIEAGLCTLNALSIIDKSKFNNLLSLLK